MRTCQAEDSTTASRVPSDDPHGVPRPEPTCLRYFINDIALVAHFKTVKHRRRLKQALDGNVGDGIRLTPITTTTNTTTTTTTRLLRITTTVF